MLNLRDKALPRTVRSVTAHADQEGKHNCWNWVDEDITAFVVPRFQEVIYSVLGKQWESLRHLPWQIASYDTNLWWQQAVFEGSRVVLNFVHQAWDETEGYSTASLSSVIKEHAHNCAVWRSDTHCARTRGPCYSKHVQVKFWDRSLRRKKKNQHREEGLHAWVMSVALSLLVRQQLTFSGYLYTLAALWHEPDFIEMKK